MVLVILGTQNMQFTRLLKAVEQQVIKGNINDEIVVQAGVTKFTSEHMKIFDLIPANEFEELIEKADLIITHAGVGSILSSISLGKKVIVAARDVKFGEHVNNHQYEILEQFVKDGYVLGIKDFNNLDQILNEVTTFEPKVYKSNKDAFISRLDAFINDN